MPKRALFFREIKDETTATRNILLCVRRTTLARPRCFDFFRTRKSPLRRPTFAFRAHSERRQLDMTTTSAVLSAYPLWSRLSTSVLSASPHFGRGQVRGAPCTESISTLVPAESTRSTGWAALARSMARSSMAKIEHGAEPRRSRCIGASGVINGSGAAPLPRGTRCVWPRHTVEKILHPALHPAVPRGGQHRTRKMGRATHSERF